MIVLMLTLLAAGCLEPEPKKEKPKKEGVIGQVTQDIGKANPDAQEADMQVKLEDGLAGYGKAYGSAVGKIAKLQIKQSLELYRAEHGNYPKTHDEFMQQIIKRQNLELPKLPGGRQYQYDVDKHELIIVEGTKRKGK